MSVPFRTISTMSDASCNPVILHDM